MTRHDRLSIWDIGMGYQLDVNMVIDMEYGISIWYMAYGYGRPPC